MPRLDLFPSRLLTPLFTLRLELSSPIFASELIPLPVGDCLSVKFTLIRKPFWTRLIWMMARCNQKEAKEDGIVRGGDFEGWSVQFAHPPALGKNKQKRENAASRRRMVGPTWQ